MIQLSIVISKRYRSLSTFNSLGQLKKDLKLIKSCNKCSRMIVSRKYRTHLILSLIIRLFHLRKDKLIQLHFSLKGRTIYFQGIIYLGLDSTRTIIKMGSRPLQLRIGKQLWELVEPLKNGFLIMG